MSDPPRTSAPAGPEPTLQEPDHLPVRLLLGVAAAVAAVAAAAIGGAACMAQATAPGRTLPELAVRTGPERVGRVYQTLIPAETTEHGLRRMQEQLDTFGWSDREKGLVRIPVERAIELRLMEEP